MFAWYVLTVLMTAGGIYAGMWVGSHKTEAQRGAQTPEEARFENEEQAWSNKRAWDDHVRSALGSFDEKMERIVDQDGPITPIIQDEHVFVPAESSPIRCSVCGHFRDDHRVSPGETPNPIDEGREYVYCHGPHSRIIHHKSCNHAPHPYNRKYIWAFTPGEAQDYAKEEDLDGCSFCKPFDILTKEDI